MRNAAGVIALGAEYHPQRMVTSAANVTADRVNVTATKFGVNSTTFKLEVINPANGTNGGRGTAVGVIAEPRRVALAAKGVNSPRESPRRSSTPTASTRGRARDVRSVLRLGAQRPPGWRDLARHRAHRRRADAHARATVAADRVDIRRTDIMMVEDQTHHYPDGSFGRVGVSGVLSSQALFGAVSLRLRMTPSQRTRLRWVRGPSMAALSLPRPSQRRDRAHQQGDTKCSRRMAP